MNSMERKRLTGFLNLLVCQVYLNELESTHGRHLGKTRSFQFQFDKEIDKNELLRSYEVIGSSLPLVGFVQET